MDRLFVQAKLPGDVIADHLHEIEHPEGAAEFEMDDLLALPALSTILPHGRR